MGARPDREEFRPSPEHEARRAQQLYPFLMLGLAAFQGYMIAASDGPPREAFAFGLLALAFLLAAVIPRMPSGSDPSGGGTRYLRRTIQIVMTTAALAALALFAFGRGA